MLFSLVVLLNKKINRINALQNRCYMFIQWTSILYYVVITWHSNPPILQFNSPVSGQCLYTIPSLEMGIDKRYSFYIPYQVIWTFDCDSGHEPFD